MASNTASPTATVTVDLTRIDDKEFDGSRPLRVAAVRNGKIVDEKTITPSKEKNPRSFAVQLSLGEREDGVAGADIVVAPADDVRNVQSKLAARKFVSGATARIDAGVLRVNPGIYTWWRYCWFPRHYRISGRILRHVDDCAHPIAGATVQIFDVDYCWWWYNEDLLKTGVTDANGFFDIHFTWCVPLWCFIVREPPILVDPILRDRIYDHLKDLVIIRWPPPPPPPDPWEWQRQLEDLGIEVPAGARVPRPGTGPVQLPSENAARRAPALSMALSSSSLAGAAKLSASDIFRSILIWPPHCDNPCDWLPDIKIRVTQNQPGGTVVIYEDSYWDIHFNLATDLADLSLEASASAIYSDDCSPEPLLGNCMLLDTVGTTHIMPVSGAPLSGIYQPDVVLGTSYGVTPDRRQRLGYVRDYDRPFAGTLGIHGRFGIAAHVDYYQVQYAKWTAADILAWDLNHAHVPPAAAFSPVPVSALGSIPRAYLEESPLPVHWIGETFAPHTVSGIPALYKSRERFEQEYRDSHGGADPAPDFGGWFWSYAAETLLFVIDSSKVSNGVYSFRFVGYRQSGVDGSGNPILALVTMGLPGGIGRRCGTTSPELVTLYLHDTVHRADCDILNFRKNGVDVIDECAMVTLTPADWIEVEYRAFDAAGHLDSYGVSLQKGASAASSIFGLAGVSDVPGGSVPEGRNYAAALADPTTPAIPPYWYGGTWRKKIAHSTFVALGGTCAYNLRLSAWDRHTNGSASGSGWGETGCEKNRAFTVIVT